MRKPYEIYKRYKRVQKKYFNIERVKATEVCSPNCQYNKEVFFSERNLHVRMCVLGQEKGKELDPTKLLICSSAKQAKECNAYAPKVKTDEQVAAIIRSKVEDFESKLKNYPELATLEWVMDNGLHDLKSQKVGLIDRFLFWVIARLESLIRNRNKIYPSD